MSIKKFTECNCPVCESPFTVYLRNIQTRRLQRDIPIYYCMDCGSFNNVSGYIEDNNQLMRDVEWHISVSERNEKWSRNFLNAVRYKFPEVKSILEIGCGTGTFLNIAQKEYGMRVVGYDTNQFAIDWGRQNYPDLPLICGLWTNDIDAKFDLIVSISTLEHLEKPRLLFSEIAKSCQQNGAATYISVPYFEKEYWHEFLQSDTAKVSGTMLYHSDVHIVHFTKRGMVTMAEQMGATSAIFFPRGWHGHWIDFSGRHIEEMDS